MSQLTEKRCPICGCFVKLHFGDVHSCISCPFKCFEEDFDRVCAAMKAQAELDALIEAARSVAAWHKGEGVIMRSELDALAALVGEG